MKCHPSFRVFVGCVVQFLRTSVARWQLKQLPSIFNVFYKNSLTQRKVAAFSLTDESVRSAAHVMIPQVSRELLARMRFPSWRLLFQGRTLVVTNTLGGGVLMALGDSLQQTREMRVEPVRVRNWKRTGERDNGSRWIIITCAHIAASVWSTFFKVLIFVKYFSKTTSTVWGFMYFNSASEL